MTLQCRQSEVNTNHMFKGIPNGDIFAIATQKNFLRRDLTALYTAIDALNNTNSFRTVQKDDAYVAVGKKGMRSLILKISNFIYSGKNSSTTFSFEGKRVLFFYISIFHSIGFSFYENHDSEISEDGFTEAEVTFSTPEKEREIKVSSKNHLKESQSRIQFLVLNTLQTRPIISVVDDVSSWKTGK